MPATLSVKRPKKPFEDTVAAAIEAAANLLARREHAPRELCQKLARKGYSSDVLDQAVDELRARDWLSESRYAAFLARHRASQARGPRWVQAELSAQGIEGEVCIAALSQDELDWDEACARAARRLPARDPEPRRRQKLYARGFAPEQIDAALAALARDTR